MDAKGNAIAASIRGIAQAEDIPVMGIAPAATLAGEPPGRRPEDLLPRARSLVSFGLPVPRGVYGETSHSAETIWRSQNLYYRRLDTVAVLLSALIEDSGEQAVPIFGCFPMGLNEKGEVMGYLNLIRMGEAAGIGTRGRNGLLLHPRYGSRLMLGGLVPPLLSQPSVTMTRTCLTAPPNAGSVRMPALSMRFPPTRSGWTSCDAWDTRRACP